MASAPGDDHRLGAPGEGMHRRRPSRQLEDSHDLKRTPVRGKQSR